MPQEINLTTNISLIRTLKKTFSDCDNTTRNANCTRPASFLRHPVGALATFDHVYTASGRYWVTVWAHRTVAGTNKSETVISNTSVVVAVRPMLMDETGIVLLLVPESAYADEPLRLIILIRNRAPGVNVTVDCDDNSGKWSMNVVDNLIKASLRDVTGPNRNRNRFRIAARSRPHSTNVNEVTSVYSRLDVAHTFHTVGDRRITVTVSRMHPEFAGDRFTVSAEISIHQRPTLADEVGTVTILSLKPAYVDEPAEFVYAVKRPHAQLEYRLDFGDGLRWSSVTSANSSTIHLPERRNNSGLKLHLHLCELFQ